MQAHDDLATIRKLMEDSQGLVLDKGQHFILWGALSAGGLVATWLAATGAVALRVDLLWIALLALGWAGSFAFGVREGRRGRVSSVGRRLLSAVWVSCGVALTLVAVAGIWGPAVPVYALPGVLSVVIGLGFAATSALTGMGGMRYLAALWWAGAAWMLFAPGVYTLLLLAAMAVLLQVVPGVALYRRARAVAQSAT
ncbi:MAG: hypothetical protein ACRELV_03205 [Longimicrobiales bacterium]